MGSAFLLGCSGTPRPAARPVAPPSAPLFTDVALAAGLKFAWGPNPRAHRNILDTIGHGCAFLDYDGDGRPDILLVGDSQPHLFHNRGDGAFEDVTAHTLPKPPAHAHFLGCAVADYDGDGRPDLFLTGYGCTALYHNEAGRTFRDVTAGSGLEARGPYDWTTSAAWADVDGEGRLDLYVCRYVQFSPVTLQLCTYRARDGSLLDMACGPTQYQAQQGSLYHNEGGGRFRDVTREVGLGDAHGYALGALFCDFNADGKPDLYVANDRAPGDLYLNRGQGRFKNIGRESGTAYDADGDRPSGMGLDWGDYDGDGRFDLLVGTFLGEPKSLYRNEGGGRFSQQSYASGLAAPSLHALTFGASFVDIDNDGLLDIVLANGHVLSEIDRADPTMTYLQSSQILRNVGGGRFADVSARAGPDVLRKIVGRGIAVGDFNDDGRLDLLIVDEEGGPLLLRNDDRSGNHWLTLRCMMRPGRSDAVGARVAITAGGRTRVAEVRAGGSYLSTNAPEVHFGLGAATQADRVEIRWPDGRTSRYAALAADHLYRITPIDNKPLLLR